jgi:hypothetical protein
VGFFKPCHAVLGQAHIKAQFHKIHEAEREQEDADALVAFR